MLLMMGIIAASCEKEGPQGPAGTNGTNGINGTNGTNGTDGNANVTVYGFGSKTFTSSSYEQSYILPITAGIVDSSVILPYYHYQSFWYPVGSVGYMGSFSTRFYISPASPSSYLLAQVRNADGSAYTGSEVIWDSTRVFVVPANVFRSSKASNVDFSDYREVEAYYSLK